MRTKRRRGHTNADADHTAPRNSRDSLAECILQALDLLDRSFAQLPHGRGKTECIDLLMQLRFEAMQAAKESYDTGASLT